MTHEPTELGIEAPWPDDVGTALFFPHAVDFTVAKDPALREIFDAHPEIEERPYQIECLDALDRVRKDGGKVALVQMATGLGKTTVVASDVKRFLSEKPDSRVLFLCHQNDILRQARHRFEQVIGKGQHSFGTYNGNTKRGVNATCVFASFQTMDNSKEVFSPETFDYIVVDESHHGKAETYEPTLKYFDPKFLLGVTATPDRKDLKDIREIFGEEVYTKSLAEALAEGLLARPDYRVIIDDIGSKLPKDENLSIADLNRSLFIPKRDEEIAKIIQERVETLLDPKTIIFCPSIEHAQRMEQLLPTAKSLHSKMKHRHRSKILEEFHSGDVRTVLTVDLFNEGIDIADANAIVFLRSTQSDTIFLQQLGRGLRKAPGKDHVLVLDFVANCDRLLMIDHLLHDTTNIFRRYSGLGGGGGSAREELSLYDLSFSTALDDATLVRELNLGNFEFSESTRQILEMIKGIQSAQLKDVLQPDIGVMTLRAFAIDLGVAQQTVRNVAQNHGIEIPRYAMGGRIARGLSSPVQEQIRSLVQTFIDTPSAPEDVVSVLAFSREVRISREILNTLIEKVGIVPQTYKFLGNVALGLTLEQQTAIKALPEVIPVPPPDVKSINTLAKETGIAFTTFKDAIAKHELPFPKYKFGPKVSEGLTAADQELIMGLPEIAKLQTPTPPPGVKSVRSFAKEIDVDKRRVQRIISRMEVQLSEYRFGSMVASGLDEEIQERIRAIIDLEGRRPRHNVLGRVL